MNGAPMDATRNFDKYIQVWNNVFSALGLSPVGFNQTERGELECKVSILRMVISLMTLVGSVLIGVLFNSDTKFDLLNLGSSLVSGYLNLVGSLIMMLLVISAMLNSRRYASLVSTFLRFNRCSVKPRTRAISIESLKFILSYFFVMIICISIDSIIFYRTDGPFLIRVLLAYIPILYVLFSSWHFAISCFWLREYLWSINRKVEKQARLFPSRAPLFGADFIKVNAVFPDRLEPQSEANANTLRHIRGLYHQVYIMSYRLNAVFATRNLLLVAHNFALGTTLIYCGLNEMFRYNSNQSDFTAMGIFNYFVWSAICFLLIYGVIWPCSKIYAEVQTTVILVQQLFTKSSEGEFQSELHSFILQLFHEQITFSPHGFFELNNQLLLSIIGSVASYLVILIQFRITLV